MQGLLVAFGGPNRGVTKVPPQSEAPPDPPPYSEVIGTKDMPGGERGGRRRRLRRKKKGVLVAFEGIDGSGKHTQIELMRRAMRGRRLSILRYPDLKGKFGRRIRRFLRGIERLDPEEQFRLFSMDIAKDRARVEAALASGAVILLDRFIASTVAYQTAGGLDFEKALSLARSLSLPEPDLTILLDLPAEAALARKRKQKGASGLHVFEKEAIFQKRVRAAYRALARGGLFSRRWLVLDGMRPPESIHEEIKAQIEKLLR